MFDQYFLTSVDFTGSRMGPNNVVPVIPATPTVLVATADSDSIGLTWTENGTYDKVFIDRKTDGDYIALASVNGGIAAYDDITAVVGTEYTYKVKGVRNGFPSVYSNTSTATIVPAGVIAPSNLTATPGVGTVTLQWQNNDLYTSVAVDRKSGGGDYSQITNEVPNAGILYVDSAPDAGVSNTYRVYGFINADQSDYSNEASTTPL